MMVLWMLASGPDDGVVDVGRNLDLDAHHISLLLISLLASDGDHVGVGASLRQIDLGVGVLPDLVDSCSSLSNDELVELLEDVNLDLVVGLQKVLVPLLDLDSALVHILLGSTQLHNLRFGANVRERDLDASIAVSDLLDGLALGPNELAVEPVLDHQILFLLILHLANHPFQFRMSSLHATLVSFDPDHCIALVNVGNVDLNIPTLLEAVDG